MCVMFLHRAVVQYKMTGSSAFITFISDTNMLASAEDSFSDLIHVKAGIYYADFAQLPISQKIMWCRIDTDSDFIF